MVYLTGLCGHRGGGGGRICAYVDFEIENVVVCSVIVPVRFQAATLFGRLSRLASGPAEGGAVRKSSSNAAGRCMPIVWIPPVGRENQV